MLNLQQGKIQISDLQRSFCWSDELVIQLLANVSLGWPIGAIMLLEQGSASWSFHPRLVEGVDLKQSSAPTHLILDGQQRATTLFMALFSGNPVKIKDKRTPKTTDRWYYIDIARALDPDVERSSTIIGFNKSRIKHSFGSEGKAIDCSTPEQEYEPGLFPVVSVFHYAQWRKQYSQYWRFDAAKLEVIDRFEREIIKRFEHYQVPVIELKPELPKPAVCQVFENVNTRGTALNFFDLATACFASHEFSLREDWLSKAQRLK